MHRDMRAAQKTILCCIAAGILGGSAARGQSKPTAAIPATAPTSVPSASTSQPSAGASPISGAVQGNSPAPGNSAGQSAGAGQTTGANQLAGTGSVDWTGTTLAVHARGESMRNLLAEISRATGMKLTGAAPSDPVFGTYGPAPVQEVLTQLFDGLPVNMVLLSKSPTQPRELQLTARVGGAVTPPAAQPVQQQQDDPTADGSRLPPGGFGVPPVPQGQPSYRQGPAVPGGAPLSGNGNGTDGVPPGMDANGQPQSPNGVKTPEQIFQELRRRQQAEQPQ